MAGLGFKDFAVGEVLTSSDVDGYLMQQTVMRFADAGARGSALGTAAGTSVPLAEGMVTYLDDANYVQVFNGSAWTSAIPGIGTNVVQAVKTDTLTFTSGSWITVTGLSATITPSSTSSKVLLIAQITASSGDNTSRNMLFRFSGGNSGTYIGDTSGTKERAVAIAGRVTTTDGWSPDQHAFNISMMYLDSPATTSAVTYNVDAWRSFGTFYINRTNNDSADRLGRFASSITAIEVAA